MQIRKNQIDSYAKELLQLSENGAEITRENMENYLKLELSKEQVERLFYRYYYLSFMGRIIDSL